MNQLILKVQFAFILICLSDLLMAAPNSEIDSDGDGITDVVESRQYRTDSQLADTDTDGLDDGVEINQYFSNPLISDSDGDGFLDGVEVRNQSDPMDATSVPDSTIVDLDGDGLTNLEEMNEYGTDFQRVDTDFDGLSDADEINIHFTDPRLVDSDGDRFWDGEEVRGSTDPHDADDFPKPK